jgi:hypothetical protein
MRIAKAAWKDTRIHAGQVRHLHADAAVEDIREITEASTISKESRTRMRSLLGRAHT